ncbi:MAG: hypothetical protein PHE78_07670 [Candidatus Gastranaerophilales bacterium]|nr:hypothetical protein [Candidatus Gastranaerophilales bacterium]
MGISSNQARFLALTARQVDLEYRTQQICQRRLRLASELETVATQYNNQISNRSLYAYNTTNSGISALTLANLKNLTDTNGNQYGVIGQDASSVYQNVTYASGTLSVGTKTYNAAALGLDSTASEEDYVEAALRQGLISVATVADEYTQEVVTVGGTNYEVKDWRTLPNIADELYKGDDATAENKYERTVTQINAQDKKLQLEQASIEVEYKAVTSEKEAVKKILDTNASTSFKYFS